MGQKILIEASNYTNSFEVLDSKSLLCHRLHHWVSDEVSELDILGPFWAMAIFDRDHSQCLAFQGQNRVIPIRFPTVAFIPPYTLFETLHSRGDYDWTALFSKDVVPKGFPQEAVLVEFPEWENKKGEEIFPLLSSNKTEGYSFFFNDPSRWQKIGKTMNYSPLAMRAKRFLDANWNSDLKMINLETELGCSSSNINKAFRESFGLNLKSYLKKMRLLTASFEALLDPVPVFELCFRSGFNNPDHFTKQFKNILHIQPKAYLSQSPN